MSERETAPSLKSLKFNRTVTLTVTLDPPTYVKLLREAVGAPPGALVTVPEYVGGDFVISWIDSTRGEDK